MLLSFLVASVNSAQGERQCLLRSLKNISEGWWAVAGAERSESAGWDGLECRRARRGWRWRFYRGVDAEVDDDFG